MISTTATMEERLHRLVAANGEQERRHSAEEAKRRGKKLLGMLDYYVPEELVMAAGMLPFRVSGVRRSDVSQATVYRPLNSDLFCTHVLEAVISGELDYLDGIITTDWDDDMRRLWDVFQHLSKPAFRPLVHVPRQDNEVAFRFYAGDLKALGDRLVELSGVTITIEGLREAIAEVNRTRQLLRRVYEWRKRPHPPITGSEALGLVTAAQVIPKPEFNQELESLLDFLAERKAPIEKLRARLLVASDHLDHPGYLQLIEGAGGLVAMDDMDTGSRYFWNDVPDDGDPYYALAKRHLLKPCCPRMFFWDKHLDQVVQWVKEFNIAGVVNFGQVWSPDRLMTAPYFEDRLKEAAIPYILLTRDYYVANLGPLRTRVEAFIETVEG